MNETASKTGTLTLNSAGDELDDIRVVRLFSRVSIWQTNKLMLYITAVKAVSIICKS